MLTVAHQNVYQQNVPAYYRYQLDNFALNVFDPQRRHLTYGKLVHQTNHRFFKEQTLTLSHQNTKEGRSSQRNGSDTRRVETDRVATLGFNLNNHSELGKGPHSIQASNYTTTAFVANDLT
ncbi:MAG: hypothetical protein R2822_19780 [Spirosomataceae bacterium]